MTIIEMLHEIEKRKCIYNIHWCNSGIGIQFYDGPDDIGEDWRKYIHCSKYYSTFEEAVETEYKKLV